MNDTWTTPRDAILTVKLIYTCKNNNQFDIPKRK